MGSKSRLYISAAVLAAGVALNSGAAFGQYIFDPGALTDPGATPSVVTLLPDAGGSGTNLVSNTGAPLLFAPDTVGYNPIFDGTDSNTAGAIQYIQFTNSSLIVDPSTAPATGDGNLFDNANEPQDNKYTLLIIYSNVAAGTNQLAGNSVFGLRSTASSDPQGVTANGNISSGNSQTTGQLTFALLSHSSQTNSTDLYQAYGDGPVEGYTLTGPGAPYPPTQSVPGSITETAGDSFIVGGSGTTDIAGIAIIPTDSDPNDAQDIIEEAQMQFNFDTPEPASISLLGLGGMGLLARRRRA